MIKLRKKRLIMKLIACHPSIVVQMITKKKKQIISRRRAKKMGEKTVISRIKVLNYYKIVWIAQQNKKLILVILNSIKA